MKKLLLMLQWIVRKRTIPTKAQLDEYQKMKWDKQSMDEGVW